MKAENFRYDTFHDVLRYVSRYVCVLVRTWTGTGHQKPNNRQCCFTVCLFISPDLDGYRAELTLRDPENCKVPIPKYEATVLHEHLSTGYPNSTNDMFHDMFVHY